MYQINKIVVPGMVLKCMGCGKKHIVAADDKENEAFLTFHGNVYVGVSGGIIGNNFDDNGHLENVSCCCRTVKCVLKSLKHAQLDNIETDEKCPKCQSKLFMTSSRRERVQIIYLCGSCNYSRTSIACDNIISDEDKKMLIDKMNEKMGTNAE